MEDALQRVADRLAAVANALMQERTARLSAEADLQSLRAQVTPMGVPPTVDHNALADSVARAVVQSASRTELRDSRAFSKLDKRIFAGTTGLRYYRATYRMRMLQCTPR